MKSNDFEHLLGCYIRMHALLSRLTVGLQDTFRKMKLDPKKEIAVISTCRGIGELIEDIDREVRRI